MYKTIILPVVPYGCTLWGRHRLRVFERKILRRIFGPKKIRKGSGEGFTFKNFRVSTVLLILHLED